jgi:hypothetical protein
MGAAVFVVYACRKPGAMCGLRLLPGEALEAVVTTLQHAVAQHVLREPPYSMRWLAQPHHRSKQVNFEPSERFRFRV